MSTTEKGKKNDVVVSTTLEQREQPALTQSTLASEFVTSTAIPSFSTNISPSSITTTTEFSKRDHEVSSTDRSTNERSTTVESIIASSTSMTSMTAYDSYSDSDYETSGDFDDEDYKTQARPKSGSKIPPK